MCSLINADSSTSDSNSEREHQLRRNNSVESGYPNHFATGRFRLDSLPAVAKHGVAWFTAEARAGNDSAFTYHCRFIVPPTRFGLSICAIHGKNGSSHSLSLHYDINTSRLNFGPDLTLASASSLMGHS
jgi:hypothetical protein